MANQARQEQQVIKSKECFQFIDGSAAAIGTWRDINDSAEANIFILSLLMWKNWEDKERRL